ncbi:hypothetical protein L7F22_056808 [Adiantum nelumboides]|nr:hypothetical protein [Adiantum nelumboides]
MDYQFRSDTLAIIQSLYRGPPLSGGHLPMHPMTNYVGSFPTTPLADYRSPRLTVSILGQQFTGVIVDGGSGINLMLEFTMLALGLKVTRPAPFTVTLADQRTVLPLGVVEQVPLQVQNFTFKLDFVVVRLPQVANGFPLLIGRPWLRHTKALHDWGTDEMWITPPGQQRKSIQLEDGVDPNLQQSLFSVQSHVEEPPETTSDEQLNLFHVYSHYWSYFTVEANTKCG